MSIQDIQFKEGEDERIRTKKLRALVEELLRLSRARGQTTTSAVTSGVASVSGTGGVEVDSADAANPVVSLTTAAQASLVLANSAVQPLDLATVATTGSASDVSYSPSGPLSSTNVQDAIDEAVALIGGGGYSDELAQDAVGSILTNSSKITFTYNDAAPSISATVNDSALSIAWSQLTSVPTPLTSLGALTDPGADRLLFWDDSASAYTHLTLGTNLSITGTTLDAAGGGGGGTVDTVVGTANEIDVDATDPANPIVSLHADVVASLALADTALQPGDAVGSAPATRWVEYTEMVWHNGVDGMVSAVSAGGTVTGSGSAAHPGYVEISTAAATATSNGILKASAPLTGAAQLFVGGGEMVYESLIEIPTLFAGGNTGQIRAGFMDEISGAPANAVHMQYDDTSANWKIIARAAGVSTTTTGGTAVTTGWHYVRIVVNAGGTSAELFIDGVSQGTVTTNIPTAGFSYGNQVQKTAGTTAAVQRVDFIRVSQTLTTARY